MARHVAHVRWRRGDGGFLYDEFDRDHEWLLGDGVRVPASAAPEFLGDGRRADPEEAFVAAISACHMLSFLALCARKRIAVDSYEDRAVGRLEPRDDGRLAVTRVALHPEIHFHGEPPENAALAEIHRLAHRECFIANSVRTEIVVERLR